MKKTNQNVTWQYILLAMIFGALVGKAAPDFAVHLKPLGDLFLNLIKMVVLPLVFCSISAAIISMEHTRSLGRIGGKSMFIYLFSTAIAIVIALFLSNAFNPVSELKENYGIEEQVEEKTSLKDSKALKAYEDKAGENSIVKKIISIVPTNPFQSFASGDVLQIIIFAVFLGIAINSSSKKLSKVEGFLNESAEVFYSLTAIVMKFAPVGVFGLIAWVVSSQDADRIISLANVVLVVLVACILHVVLVYGGFIVFLARLNPVIFIRKILDAMIMAFSTSSSSATLPVTLKVAEEKLGVSNATAKFVLPLGSTVNMDGTAIYLGVCAVFVAGFENISLSMVDYLTIVVTATIASIGAAGIPGTAMVMMSMIFTAIGLPLEAILTIVAIDRILDMVRTTVNVIGDLTISVVIDRSEGTFDEKKFNS